MKTYKYYLVLLLSLVLLTACTGGLNQNTDQIDEVEMDNVEMPSVVNDEIPSVVDINEPDSIDSESLVVAPEATELPPEGENDFVETPPKPVGELEVESKVPQSESNDTEE